MIMPVALAMSSGGVESCAVVTTTRKLAHITRKDLFFRENVVFWMNPRVLVTTPSPSPRNTGYAQTSSLDRALAEAISAKKIVNMTNPVKVILFNFLVSWFCTCQCVSSLGVDSLELSSSRCTLRRLRQKKRRQRAKQLMFVSDPDQLCLQDTNLERDFHDCGNTHRRN